ncbi:MAG: FKBP-type peptidyl-prolyl cis-trans isomerase [Bacteroidetes bacterium]|nr:FKBP-type peptidyl-prolyl cis-trans isomerase [Bacteroidota bacterium]
MKTRSLFSVIVVLTFLLGMSSCGPEELRGYKKTESGLYYQFHVNNKDSAKPALNDILTVEMTYSVNDTVLFNSKGLNRPMQFPLMLPVFKGDFYEGIAMMHKGDSASFKCAADSVILKILKAKKLPSFVKHGDLMLVNVKLKNFYTQEQFNLEKKKFLEQMKARGNALYSTYLEKNKVTEKPEPSGLIIQELRAGKGKIPVKGQKVRIDYLGTFTDGTKFDSSYDRGKHYEFVIGNNEVIPGLDEGVQKMKTGSKVRLIIPDELAYGPRNVGEIPPHTPIIYEIELLEILN